MGIFKINKKWLKKYFFIVGSITGIYLVLAFAVTLTLIAAEHNVFIATLPTPRPDGTVNAAAAEGDPSLAGEDGEPLPITTPPPEEDEHFLKPPARTHFLLIALDQEGVLTDALMAGCFYRDSYEIKLMSIPRDLYTRIPEERLARMRNDNLHPPANGIMKINALRSYGGGRSFGNKYLVEQLGEMLGVNFMYYVEVDIPAFKKIVDVLGGVTMDIPAGGLYYDDPEQDLHIAIPGGRQFIDGDMAEGLVRFRRYPTGDLGRNAMQMEFMQQIFKQALSRETILSDPLAVLDIILNDVRTNVGADIIKYTPYATKITSDKLTTYTMPGEGAYVGDVSYFFPDRSRLPEKINEVFYATPAIIEDEAALGTEGTGTEGAGTEGTGTEGAIIGGN